MKKVLILILALFVFLPANASDLTILHTSDVHGRLGKIDYHNDKNVGGFARRVEYMNSVKKKDKSSLILDSGDYFQGSLYYQVYKGKKSVKLMKYAKYDASTLGNHEFDRGIVELKKLLKTTHVPFLSANVKFADVKMQKLVKPFIIKKFDNKKVLIIGVTTPDVKFLSSSEGFEVVEPISVIKQIIAENPADIVIVTSHCGIEWDKKIAQANPNVDLILGGHNHLLCQPVIINSVPIITSGELGVNISQVEFSYDKGFEAFKHVKMDNEISENKKVAKKISKIDNDLNKIKSTVLSYSTMKLLGEQTFLEHNQTNLGRLILKSMVQNQTYDVALINSGGVRVNRDIQGNISLADAMEILPFENSVVKAKIDGKSLDLILKQGKSYGRVYLQVYSKIKKIDYNKQYTIITTSYLIKGKDKFKPFENATDIEVIYPNQQDAFIEFLKANPKIVDETLIMP